MLVLPREECLRLLASHGFGRLAVAMDPPVVRPVNYMFDERSQSVAFRTTAGSKFHAMLINGSAAFEIDGIDPGSHTGWSVIIVGITEQVISPSEVRRLNRLNSSTYTPSRVLIVGGGVAGLEAALALHELAGERVTTTVLASATEFVYRPMRVREPFGYSTARRYPLDEICRDTGAELVRDAFKWLDPDHRTVHTEAGEKLEYDALLLAPGATSRPRFRHALTLDDGQLDEQLHGLVQDVEGGYVHKLAFISPTPMPWPLPLYELALMTARRAYDMNVELSVTLLTPEDAPLALFGPEASCAVARLLEESAVRFVPSAHSETPVPGRVSITPGSRNLIVDRIVALPQLFGPSVPGVPTDAHGFIPIDVHCRVPRLERVFAAGDGTDFGVKHGGIAAQQADAAAEAIAALAGAPIEPRPFQPTIYGALIGGPGPLYLSAHVTGGHGSSSEVSEAPTSSPPSKIAAKYLAPYLESRDRAALR